MLRTKSFLKTALPLNSLMIYVDKGSEVSIEKVPDIWVLMLRSISRPLYETR